MVRRVTDPALAVETVVWPGRNAGSAAGGPRLHAPRLAEPPGHAPPGQPGAGQGAPNLIEAAELDRRVAELDRLRQLESAEARHKGVEDGLRRGREEAAAEVQKAFDQVAHTLEELAQTKRKLRREAEMEMVKLSLAVARRILYRELSTDPSAIEGIVHAALDKLQQRETSRVRVFPAGVAAVRSALERNGTRTGIEVVADPGLTTGSLLFETAQGDLDASVDTQLQEIQRGFADRLAIR